MEKAFEKKSTDRALADWMKDMAATHMKFNEVGMSLVKKHMDEIASQSNKQDYNAGMLAVWEIVCEDIAEEANEVKAMIDGYK